MTEFTLEHPWDHAAAGVDWTHWWSPNKSMQAWLPWGSDKKASIPQIRHYYLNHTFRQACADLGISIDDSQLNASGSVTFSGKANNTGEITIDSAQSLPIEAIYYMLLVEDKEKLARMCEFVDKQTLASDPAQSSIEKQDLLNIAITMHDLIGADPSLISPAVMEQAISANSNFTPEQRQEMLALLKKRHDIVKALSGLFTHMQVPIAEITRVEKQEIRILIDKTDQKALAQAQAMQQEYNQDGKHNVEIVDLHQLDAKIAEFIESETIDSGKMSLLEERFAGLMCAAGTNQILRHSFTNEGVSEIIIGIGNDTSDFVAGLGVSIGATQKLWSVEGNDAAMSKYFNLPKGLGVQCIVSDPALAKQNPDVCTTSSISSDYTPPSEAPH